MKKINKNILVLLCGVLLFSSCSDFLKEEDKDKVIPKTPDQYLSMINKIFLQDTWNFTTDLMTDDVTENSKATTKGKSLMKSLYTWQKDLEYDGLGNASSYPSKWWKSLYNNILVANYILEHVDEIKNEESFCHELKAESYFLRARCYFELANLYAPAYNSATAESTIGVPIRLDTGVKNSYIRSSLKSVYTQIESDLNNALTHFDNSKEVMSLWHPNKNATLLLKSRVMLYKGDWDKVIEITSSLINNSRGGLMDLKSLSSSAFVTKNNPEIFHTYGACSDLIVENDGTGAWQNDVPVIYAANDNDGGEGIAYGISDDLLNAFLPGDLRKSKYLVESDGKDIPAKWHSRFTKLGACNYRLSEAYLNRAEAYAAKGMYSQARADLVSLISKRVSDISQVSIPTDDSKLRAFVLDERRREFCGESFRWFDLKRNASWYGKTIKHSFTLRSAGSGGGVGSIQGSELYLFSANDPNFVFEIPDEEIEINSKIELYKKRVEKNAIIN